MREQLKKQVERIECRLFPDPREKVSFVIDFINPAGQCVGSLDLDTGIYTAAEASNAAEIKA